MNLVNILKSGQYTFNETSTNHQYHSLLTASENRKGVLDVDTVKGCTLGLQNHINGCYGECYAYKNARRYGIDFSKSVSRKGSLRHLGEIFYIVKNHYAKWYRIGTAGDPCHDWENTISVIESLKYTNKTPVIITKHWISLTDTQIQRLKNLKAIINTSTSGLDTNSEIEYRVNQIKRLRESEIKCICRVVTCKFGNSAWAKDCNEKQDYLLSLKPTIDNPLRLSKKNQHFTNGDILAIINKDAIGGEKLISLNNSQTYLGTCYKCPDQCGINL